MATISGNELVGETLKRIGVDTLVNVVTDFAARAITIRFTKTTT